MLQYRKGRKKKIQSAPLCIVFILKMYWRKVSFHCIQLGDKNGDDHCFLTYTYVKNNKV